MTKFQFISELLTYINLLLETDLTPCVTSISQSCLDDLFENYEQSYDEQQTPNNRRDLKHYHYIIDNLLQKGVALYEEEKPKNTTVPTMKTILKNIADNSEDVPEVYCFTSECS